MTRNYEMISLNTKILLRPEPDCLSVHLDNTPPGLLTLYIQVAESGMSLYRRRRNAAQLRHPWAGYAGGFAALVSSGRSANPIPIGGSTEIFKTVLGCVVSG